MNDQERDLLDWMLRASSADSRFVDQAANARVVGSCTCGCPSIDVSVNGSPALRLGPSQIVADAEGTSPEGSLVGVILHAREGLLAELEIYSQDGLAPDGFGIPKPKDLSIV